MGNINNEKKMNEFEKDQKKTLDLWVDSCFRAMREKFRVCVTCWTKNEYDLLIENAKDLRKNLDSFIDYLGRRKKFE
jgi:hypothetical protein